MDFYSSYLTGINQIIGQNGRFARQFVANQEAGGNAPGGTTTGGTGNVTIPPGADAQTATMILMLFQLMAQMLGGVSPSIGSGNGPTNAPTPYVPGLPSGNVSQPITQNPAVVALEKRMVQKAGDDPEGVMAFSEEDVQAIRAEMQAGAYTPTELGQALMYGLDQASMRNLQPITRLITDLTDSGELNITPFLQNDYLAKLGPERRDALLSAVELAGLRLDSGKANTRLIGFVLDNLAKPGEPQTKAFIQQFLQDFYNAHGKTPETPVGKILSQTLDLAGIVADDQGKLVF